jgi:hypothetical protein
MELSYPWIQLFKKEISELTLITSFPIMYHKQLVSELLKIFFHVLAYIKNV